MTRVLLAEAADVHVNTLGGYHLPTWNPTRQTLDKITAAVGRLEDAISKGKE